jgi:Trk K+ transport system NAD-binding subunit
VVIPQPDTLIKEKDILMAVVQVTSLKKVRERFGLGEK